MILNDAQYRAAFGHPCGDRDNRSRPNRPLTDLGPGTGMGINNSGQVLLKDRLYSSGVFAPLGMEGAAINDAGHITGTANGYHIGLYVNGVVTDLGSLPGTDPHFAGAWGRAINSLGEIAGAGGRASSVWGFVYRNF